MTGSEVVARFRAELEADDQLAQLVVMAQPLLASAPPAAVVGTLDAIVIRYCRARGASLELPEVSVG